MDNEEGVQEQMKVDLSALKDQMASITDTENIHAEKIVSNYVLNY